MLVEEKINFDLEVKFEELLDKINKINEEVSYLKDLFQRRLLLDKQNEKLINAIKQDLNYRNEIEKGNCFIDLFRELLHVIDYLESDLENELNNSLAEQIITVFERRNFEIIDINNLDNPLHYEVSDVEESENVKFPEIAELLSKGYILNGKVIRPAKVKMYKPYINFREESV